jgi:phosphoribosylformylglycinamidine (FGAM) synthase-like enzyme
VSEGGLFITLLESAMVNCLGFEIETDATIRKDAFLFGEGQSRVVVSTSSEKAFVIENICKEFGVPVNVLGTVTDGKMSIDGQSFGNIVDYKHIYDNAIGNFMTEAVTA